jgi:essential nuclear protein 1
MPRTSKNVPGKLRHDPLHVELDADDQIKKYGNVSRPGKRKSAKKSENNEEEVGGKGFHRRIRFDRCMPQTVLDSKTSRKILQLARDQQEELELNEELELHGSEAKR